MLKENFLEKLASYYYNIADIRVKYKRIKSVFFDVVDTLTEGVAIGFADRYTRLRFIYDNSAKVSPELRSALALMSKRAHNVIENGERPTIEEVKADVVALARFIIATTNEVPHGAFAELVNSTLLKSVVRTPRKTKLAKVRLVVSSVDEKYLYGYDYNGETTDLIRAMHGVEGVNDKMRVNGELFSYGAIVNLIDCTVQENGDLIPQLFILNPDYLLDCSMLADSVRDYGLSPFTYIFGKVKQDKISSAMLLGNIANYYHDAFVYNGTNVDYVSTTNEAFATMPIELTACDDIDDKSFFTQTRTHFDNINRTVNQVFPTLGIDKNFATLEPTFICEDIGMQGRLDFLHLKNNNNIVIELKSGKVWPEDNPSAIDEKHKSQAFLYQIMIQKTINVPFHNLSTYIFYSKYPTCNLRKATPYMDALRKILDLRNRIVSVEYKIAAANTSDKTKQIFDFIQPQFMIRNYNPNRLGKLLRDYIVPSIEQFRKEIDSLDNLTQKYIYSFANFILREQAYAKVGGVNNNRSGGFASCWNASLDEKIEAGTILYDLRISSLESTEQGVQKVTLKTPALKTDYIANFRRGDIAILYVRNNSSDLITNKEVLKCAIASISDKEIVVALRQNQKNTSIFNDANMYALEPDYMDSSFGSLLRNVFSLSRTEKNRRELLLGRTLPTVCKHNLLKTEIANEDVRRIVQKAKDADGYFLLVGPPGTGKTSVALRDMVKEFYAEGSNILLLAYTNRAVDEICASVKSAGLDFIRIGHHLNSAPEFHDYLLAEKIKNCKNRNAVKQVLMDSHIFIATTTTINSKSILFNIIQFNVAIIDEASQILEPQILGVLSAQNSKGKLAIDKFVMIGDHKQLPAVVVQSQKESAIPKEDAELYDIDLTDRRNSLFERLYSLNKKANNNLAYDMLTHQGRMHEEVAEFSNLSFYEGRLECVPLEHQTEKLSYKKFNNGDKEEVMIATKRLAFIPSEKTPYIDNVKTNPHEAETVVRIVLKTISLMNANGIEFNNKSIGIITSYRSQIALIRKRLEEYKVDTSMITIDTVERYQGSQRDVIIFSLCVNDEKQLQQISNVSEQDGVVVDRKLNVALTRARKQMFITGCKEILINSPIYSRLITYLESKN